LSLSSLLTNHISGRVAATAAPGGWGEKERGEASLVLKEHYSQNPPKNAKTKRRRRSSVLEVAQATGSLESMATLQEAVSGYLDAWILNTEHPPRMSPAIEIADFDKAFVVLKMGAMQLLDRAGLGPSLKSVGNDDDRSELEINSAEGTCHVLAKLVKFVRSRLVVLDGSAGTAPTRKTAQIVENDLLRILERNQSTMLARNLHVSPVVIDSMKISELERLAAAKCRIKADEKKKRGESATRRTSDSVGSGRGGGSISGGMIKKGKGKGANGNPMMAELLGKQQQK
jgi:hypothetical protein